MNKEIIEFVKIMLTSNTFKICSFLIMTCCVIAILLICIFIAIFSTFLFKTIYRSLENKGLNNISNRNE